MPFYKVPTVESSSSSEQPRRVRAPLRQSVNNNTTTMNTTVVGNHPGPRDDVTDDITQTVTSCDQLSDRLQDSQEERTLPHRPHVSNGGHVTSHVQGHNGDDGVVIPGVLRDAIYRSSRTGWQRRNGGKIPTDVVYNNNNNNGGDDVTEYEQSIGSGSNRGESLIAKEIREQKEREDEWRRVRRRTAADDVMMTSQNSDITASECSSDSVPSTNIAAAAAAAGGGDDVLCELTLETANGQQLRKVDLTVLANDVNNCSHDKHVESHSSHESCDLLSSAANCNTSNYYCLPSVDNAIKKFASSRLQLDIERQKQRELELQHEKSRDLEQQDGGAGVNNNGNKTECVSNGQCNSVIPQSKDGCANYQVVDQSVTAHNGQEHNNTEDIVSPSAERVDGSKQLLTHVRASFIEREITELYAREEELRRQRELIQCSQKQ